LTPLEQAAQLCSQFKALRRTGRETVEETRRNRQPVRDESSRTRRLALGMSTTLTRIDRLQRAPDRDGG
jgi:hypothetical protein